MIYPVKVVIVFVQIGANLWVNPDKVTGLRIYDGLNGSEGRTCVMTPQDGCLLSDWPIEKVKNVLEGNKN